MFIYILLVAKNNHKDDLEFRPTRDIFKKGDIYDSCLFASIRPPQTHGDNKR